MKASCAHDTEISGALRVLGAVTPRPAFEERLLARLGQQERIQGPLTSESLTSRGVKSENTTAVAPNRKRAFHLTLLKPAARKITASKFTTQKSETWMQGNPLRIAMGAMAAMVAAVAILIGSTSHRHAANPRATTAAPLPAPTLPASRSGFGTASGTRLPAEQKPNQPYLTPRGRATGRSRHGRAVLPALPSHRAHGSATPRSPYGQSPPGAGHAPPNQPPSTGPDVNNH